MTTGGTHPARCLQALLNLLLTGRASPNVFNGTLHCGEDGRPLQRPLQGVLSRSDVGYLHWNREQMERGRLPLVQSFYMLLKLLLLLRNLLCTPSDAVT